MNDDLFALYLLVNIDRVNSEKLWAFELGSGKPSGGTILSLESGDDSREICDCILSTTGLTIGGKVFDLRKYEHWPNPNTPEWDVAWVEAETAVQIINHLKGLGMARATSGRPDLVETWETPHRLFTLGDLVDEPPVSRTLEKLGYKPLFDLDEVV